MKILNLYAGIGGNRKLWPKECEVTAVEMEADIAEAYQHFFPQDRVIVGDAHQYLLDHHQEYDFIWASPPCPTHSVMGFLGMKNYMKIGAGPRTKKLEYPDMKLYQEIIFLKHFFKGLWVIENTKSYYDPLIEPQISGAHFFWSNFNITNRKQKKCRPVSRSDLSSKEKIIGFDVSQFSFKNIKSTHKKDKVLNNCVDPELGLHIFRCAFMEEQKTLL